MKILLTAATTFEIESTLKVLEQNGFLANQHQVDVLITGIGPVSTTYLLTTRLLASKPGLVIQAGIAGSFSYEAIGPGETVLVKYDAWGDIGMEESGRFTSVFDAGFAGKNHFPYADGWLINPHPLLATTALKVVKSVTINKVSDSVLQKQQLIDAFAPHIETMEGAALHYVCLQQEVPFLQVRTVSNEVGERDKAKWKMKEAVDNLNRELQQLLSFQPTPAQ